MLSWKISRRIHKQIRLLHRLSKQDKCKKCDIFCFSLKRSVCRIWLRILYIIQELQCLPARGESISILVYQMEVSLALKVWLVHRCLLLLLPLQTNHLLWTFYSQTPKKYHKRREDLIKSNLEPIYLISWFSRIRNSLKIL
jgi:hypothetical protein